MLCPKLHSFHNFSHPSTIVLKYYTLTIWNSLISPDTHLLFTWPRPSKQSRALLHIISLYNLSFPLGNIPHFKTYLLLQSKIPGFCKG